MHRGVGRQVAGWHENVVPIGIRNLPHAFRNCFAQQGGLTAEYRINYIHISRSHELFTVEFVYLADGHPGIDGDAISSCSRLLKFKFLFGQKNQAGIHHIRVIEHTPVPGNFLQGLTHSEGRAIGSVG